MSVYGVRDALLDAKRVVAFTGAGVSVPSGIPDFRSADGIWARYPPEEYATLTAFLDDPVRWWGFYRDLARSFADVRPNPAHEALAELERLGLLEAVITQNIDGLHQRAGNTKVVELHGGDGRLKCVRCDVTRAGEAPLEGPPPVCATCGQVLKPDVVLFGELLPRGVLDEALALARGADVCLVVGTSAVVYPAAAIPEETARTGGTVCQFDLGSTDLTHTGRVRWFIEGSAEQTLPRVVALVAEARSGARKTT